IFLAEGMGRLLVICPSRLGKYCWSCDGAVSEGFDREPDLHDCRDRFQNELDAAWSGPEGPGKRLERLCDRGHKAVEAEDIEHAGEVVTERHQTPFAADLVEAANQEVAIAGATFERAEGMLDDGGTTAHQVACAFHPPAMTFENILVLPATDSPS